MHKEGKKSQIYKILPNIYSRTFISLKIIITFFSKIEYLFDGTVHTPSKRTVLAFLNMPDTSYKVKNKAGEKEIFRLAINKNHSNLQN